MISEALLTILVPVIDKALAILDLTAFTLVRARSTIYDWRQEKESKYVGHEFASKVSKNLGHTNVLLDDRVKYERELFVAFSKIKFTIINIIGKASFKKLLQDNKPRVVEMIEKVKPIFKTGTLCKFLNIEEKTYSV